MATRSNIGIVNSDGSVTGIYCHYDGYPENNGKLLLNHYTTSGIVNELMDLGNLSYLAENLYSDNNSHSFKNPVDGVCVAYGRDRGEKGEESKTFENISEFEKYGNDSAADYQYLFNNGKWTYREFRSDDWSDLTLEDCRY